jgi:hypothetical protein
VLILDLYFLQVGLQIGFEGLNLEVVAGVALTIVFSGFQLYLSILARPGPRQARPRTLLNRCG